jgi:phytoene dehydrogenase-like protein
MFGINRNEILLGGPIVPIGGSRGVIKGLEKIILTHNSKIITNTDVQEILVCEGKTKGVIVKIDGEYREVKGKYVVSNLGPIKTYEKINEYGYSETLSPLKKREPPAGITICVGASRDMLGHSGIALTPIGERVCEIVQPTTIDSTLAPKGKHLLLTHQILKTLTSNRFREHMQSQCLIKIHHLLWNLGDHATPTHLKMVDLTVFE